MRRINGAAGIPTPKSDKNLLAVFNEHEALLPRNVYVTVETHEINFIPLLKVSAVHDKSSWSHFGIRFSIAC